MHKDKLSEFVFSGPEVRFIHIETRRMVMLFCEDRPDIVLGKIHASMKGIRFELLELVRMSTT